MGGMLNKTYRTVWNRTTRTYVAVSEVTKRYRATGASVCRALVAASAGLLAVLTSSQAARADDCTPQTQSCLNLTQALISQVASSSAPAANDASMSPETEAAIDNASVFAGTPAAAGVAAAGRVMMLAAAATPAVTDYISVSPNVVQGTRTSASDSLNAMAIGPASAAMGIDALAVGGAAAAGSDGSTAVGSMAGALSNNSTVVGAGATVGVMSDNSIALGYQARSVGLNSASIGGFGTVAAVGGVAIGYQSFVIPTATNGVTIGSNTTATLGGGSTVNPDGTLTASSYNVDGTVVNSVVGGALTHLDGRMTQNSTDIAGLQTSIGNLNGTVANAVQYDSSAHNKVTLGGTAANPPKVS